MKRVTPLFTMSLTALVFALIPVPARCQEICRVRFGLASPASLTLLSLSVDDGGSGAFVTTSDPLLDCRALGPTSAVAGVSQGGDAMTLALYGFAEPLVDGIDLAECVFDPAGASPPAPSRFVVSTTAAVSSSGVVDPLPAAEVREVVCGVPTTTSTTTTTTSTTSTVAPTTTTTLGAGGMCGVTFALDDAIALRSFVVEFTYGDAAGGDFAFATAPGSDMLGASCTLAPGITPQSFDTDNSPSTNLLRMSMSTSLRASGILQGPTDLATCTFLLANDSPGPSPADFLATVTQATDQSLQPVSPPPSFSVSAVSCLGPGETTTTTTVTTTTTLPSACVCGDPVLPGGGPSRLVNASDALFTLRAAVGSEQCALCACDVNDSGAVSATDALLILQAAVGRPVVLSCPGAPSK